MTPGSILSERASNRHTTTRRYARWGAAGRAVEVFAQVHEREKGIEDAGFHFVCQVQAARRRAGQHFPVLCDEADNLRLARVRRLAVNGFAAHLRARFFDLQREMQQAQTHRFERIRHLSLASVFAAGN